MNVLSPMEVDEDGWPMQFSHLPRGTEGPANTIHAAQALMLYLVEAGLERLRRENPDDDAKQAAYLDVEWMIEDLHRDLRAMAGGKKEAPHE
jgi:hypothetical protein